MRIASLVAALTLFAVPATARDKDTQGDLAVMLKGGVAGYLGELNELSAAGPAWGVLVNLQPMNTVGVELGYDGSKNNLTDDRLASPTSLNRHSANALLKLGLPFIEKVKPFVGVGLGATFVSVAGERTPFYRNDIMEEVPLAAGLELNSGAITAGVRTSYRILFDQGYAASGGARPLDGSILDASATVGGRF